MLIKVEGLEQFSLLLNILGPEIKTALLPKLREITTEIRDEAKRRCPVDTGSLQKSIRLYTKEKSAGTITNIGVSAGGYITNPKTGKKVDYAQHVEYGTSKAYPQPFLRPAYINSELRLRQLVKIAVINSIRENSG